MSGRSRDERTTAAPAAVAAALPPLMGVERVAGVGAGGAEALNGAPAPPERAEEPPRKRTKLDDAPALRKRVLEHKLLRLKTLRDRYTEQLSELYFLQAGGNMMDYAAWRKRPPAPQLLSFLDARRPPPVAAAPEPPPAAAVPAAPAASAAPAAPAAPAASLAVVPAAAAADPSAPTEMVEKARQEAYVAARVAELARAGLWAERRLPRVCEPPRPKTHWDYLLEEMAWLAQDFAHERKWKKQAAKKCARAVQKYFQDKAAAAQKAEKAQELQLKRISAFAAKEIRTFWLNVEKLVEWKRSRRVERARKEALDEQLSIIVDRTERYSRQLAASLQPQPDTPPSDDEFTPRHDEDDDEETIAAAEQEAQHDAAHHRDELEALRRESRLALPELLPPGYTPLASPPPSPGSSDYSADQDSADDEDTIAAQERRERSDHAQELHDLQHEADLDLDELRRRYAAAPPAPASDRGSSTEEDSDDDSDASSSASGGSEKLAALVAGGAEGAGSEQRVEAAASLAATLQPTGTTLQSTAVGTPVPRLLRHSLREYQHVGLHWLATMHARALNGILADEMGLGKTIQTIALLAHLALEHQDWGPHLVVAPTSVVLNWEMEFKKWCPAFKILTYYGTIKERKLKRVGWTKPNSFHVCITSYKLVVQDHQSFRRKRWRYLVLDEAQNIKNFKSQRWQMLLNFQTDRRLLLTGTPLQNSLLELWSLMHFLMPDVFASHSEFREWFAPVAALAGEGGAGAGTAQLVRRLHEVLRPFLLRRLKADVERQMPRKYEHVLLCRLAKRQRCLYDDFMARAKTKESLASGNLLSVINVLMQLRKVCNHPDLFEPRAVSSPFHMGALRLRVPALALLEEVRARGAAAARLGGDLATLEAAGAGAFAAHRARHLAPPRRLVHELCSAPPPAPPRPPEARLRLHLRLVPRAPAAAALGAQAAPPLRVKPARVAPSSAPPAPPPPPAEGAAARLEERRRGCLRRLALVNERRCWRLPLFGADLRRAVCAPPPAPPPPLHPPDLDTLLENMHEVIDRFSVCWRACVAPAPVLAAGAGGGARGWRHAARGTERALCPAARAALRALHAPASRQAVAFPHPRLLQFDCGKLQALAPLLRRLKAGGHRVLIFTQMTRVLDVLEGFLSLHGHAYARLDGATKVERRQALVERFNADPRLFAFILSTRSGGVGLNLTGADCVIFYDSDWNPTMDAQAQDRCHRIGQTRDVHVFRLVTQATVEENILRKATEKRRLGELAIDDGNFTTSYLREASIKELFGAGAEVAAGGGEGGEGGAGGAGQAGDVESALAAAEDEADAAAARAARAEQQGELAEFDETLPYADPDHPHQEHKGKDELALLMDQLTPIEKYAMRCVESSEAGCEAEREALSAVRRSLGDWERRRRREPEPEPAQEPEPEPDLTYSRRDADTKVWLSGGRGARAERMPIWCPPSPPASDGDGELYRPPWARALYRAGAAPEHALPPLPRARAPRPAGAAPVVPHAARAPRLSRAPPSLFERAGAGARVRVRPRAPPDKHKDAPAPDWAPAEDAALRRALRLQRLPADPPPARAPNWEWAAELVADVARAYRAPRACRDRHERLAAPDDRDRDRVDRPDRDRQDRHERQRRKQRKPGARRRADDDAPRPPLARLDAMREAAERRRAAPKRRLDDAQQHNPKHAQLLADHGLDYERPPTPMEVASRRADRIAKEKSKAAGAGSSVAAAAPPAASAAPATAPPGAAAAAPSQPARVVVAAHAAAGKAEAARRARAQAVAGASVSVAGAAQPQQLLYRHQPLQARHHLKILHHATAQPTQGSATVPGTHVSVAGESALRTLQLQQLAMRRGALPPAAAAPPGGGGGGGAVVAPRLLARAVVHAPAPAPQPQSAPAPQPAQHPPAPEH